MTSLFFLISQASCLSSVLVSALGASPKVTMRERGFERAVDANEVSGLELSISYEIVQAHQGRIWVESELGQGTTFYVELPLT